MLAALVSAKRIRYPVLVTGALPKLKNLVSRRRIIMPLVINTNVGSLNAQRQLVKSGDDLMQAMERLSSGQRINTAADDAAGLAISNRMTSQVRGLDQAIRNANDGISLIQTAEGALQESTNIMQRMRELAIQSANGIYTDADRATLDAESQQLILELQRISQTTTFNGQKLLDGSLQDKVLQVGALANETIDIALESFDPAKLGVTAAQYDIVATETTANDLLAGLQVIDGTTEVLSINGVTVGDLSGINTVEQGLNAINAAITGAEVSAVSSFTAANVGTGIISGDDYLQISLLAIDKTTPDVFTIKNTTSMEEVVDKINTLTDGSIQASLNDEGKLVLQSETGATITVDAGDSAGTATEVAANKGAAAAGFGNGNTDYVAKGQLVINNTDSSSLGVDISFALSADATAAANAADAVGLQARRENDITGVAVTAANGTTYSFEDGDIEINGIAIDSFSYTNASPAVAANYAQAIADAINAQSDEHGVVAELSTATLVLNSVDGSEISIKLNSDNTDTSTIGLFETNALDLSGDALADISIATAEGAQSAIEIIDLSLEAVNLQRSQLGAINNRLDFTISNIMNVSENTSAARSRIMDADFAAETAELSRAQVLQQASQAMLAQANARPQQVLQLLQ